MNMKSLLTNGSNANISRKEVKKIEREAVLDLNKKTDLQEDLLKNIAKDIITSNDNLTGIVVEVKNQGGQIQRIQSTVADTGTSVKRADKNITIMQRRNYCVKMLLHILAVTLLLANIALVIYKISR
jgi:predicted phage tail protein